MLSLAPDDAYQFTGAMFRHRLRIITAQYTNIKTDFRTPKTIVLGECAFMNLL